MTAAGALTEFLVREGLGSESVAVLEQVGAGEKVAVQRVGGGQGALQNHLQVAKHQRIQGRGAGGGSAILLLLYVIM